MLACSECRKLYPNDAAECAEHGARLVPLEALPEEDPTLEAGTMIGEYRVLHKLGSGTFGDVYAGEQPLIGKQVAIKVLHRKYTSNSGVVSRFVSEARAVNRVRHRNIIDIFSFGLQGGQQPYFVMERLEGMTLGELLAREERLAVADAIPILKGIADGLDAAHDAGITHRDLKPDNIFLVKEKEGGFSPKLLDFGVAKLLADDLAHKTATGAAVGTPSYMAPEQCRGRPLDHRADIYALGVVIHEMLTGRRLFPADSAMEVLLKHVSEAPPSMSSVCPDLPKDLDAPVLAMLAKSPSDRPVSAGAAVAALIEQARAIGAEGGAVQGAVDRAPTRRDDVTVVDTNARARAAASARTSSGDAAPAQSAAEASGAVVISVDEATSTEPDAASAHTMMAPVSPASGTLVAGGPPSSAMRPAVAAATIPSEGPAPASETAIERSPVRSDPKAATPAGRSRAWSMAIAGGAVIAAAALVQQGGKPKPVTVPGAAESAAATASARPLPGKVTIQLMVTPADADVIVDGLRVGSARDPLSMARSDQTRAIRVEKEGYEAQALWIVPDRDHELPPIALRAAPAVVIPTVTPAKMLPVRPARRDDLDLERPPELERPK